MSRHLRPGAVAFGLLVALWLGAAAHAGDVVQVSAEQAKALGVETAPLSRQDAGGMQALPAQVVVPNTQLYVVSAPVAGLIEHVAAPANTAVKRGQVLARLQSHALADLQRGYLQAATQLQLAKENLARDEQLAKEGIIADSRYRATRSHYTEAAAAYAERRQALRLAGLGDGAIERLQSGRAISAVEITSPAEGVVLEQSTLPGQRVEAAAPLFKVARLNPLWLEIQVPVAQLSGVAEGGSVTVPAYEAAGRVIAIGRSVSANQTVMVRAEMREGVQRLRPGQFVEATLAMRAGNGKQWSVPNAALARSEGRLFVFVQTTTGFRVQAVDAVNEGATHSIVSGPLKDDERIAVRGVAALKAALSGIGVQ